MNQASLQRRTELNQSKKMNVVQEHSDRDDLRHIYYCCVEMYTTTPQLGLGWLKSAFRNMISSSCMRAFSVRYCGGLLSYTDEEHIDRIDTHMRLFVVRCLEAGISLDETLRAKYRRFITHPHEFQEGELEDGDIPVDLVGDQVIEMIVTNLIRQEEERQQRAIQQYEHHAKPTPRLPILSKIATTKPKRGETIECAICFETKKVNERVTLNCGHFFCHGCMKQQLKTHHAKTQHANCALCREPIQSMEFSNKTKARPFAKYCAEVHEVDV